MQKHLLSLVSRKSAAAAIIAAATLTGSVTQAAFIANFDGGNTTAHAFTSSSGSPPSIQNGGPSGNYARLTNLNGSNNNSIAFDEAVGQTGPAPGGLKMAFNFRLSTDQQNADAGGCCGSAADGIGVGLFSTAAYGATGGKNPTGADWERPKYANALTVGVDVFQNIDVLNLNWAGTELAAVDVKGVADLNDGKFHRVVVDVKPNGANALIDMHVIEDVMGATIVRPVMSNVAAPGLNLAALPSYRVIAGGRTGGAFAAGDIDNIYVDTVPVPEPASLALLGLGGLSLLGLRRRK